jgi:hypothetical protein
MAFGLPPKHFERTQFSLQSTHFVKSSFVLHYTYIGPAAKAEPGAMAAGDKLLVCFQADSASEIGLGVWLTIENRSTDHVRWFGPSLTAYTGGAPYAELHPDPDEEFGGHLMIDIYPGEQFTCYYHFTFIPPVLAPKYLTCHSWDTIISFIYAHGV